MSAISVEQRKEYLEKLQKIYTKHPPQLLEMIIDVYDKQTNGTDEEKAKIAELLEQVPKRPDLTYFGSNGFQEEIVENKGFKVETK